MQKKRNIFAVKMVIAWLFLLFCLGIIVYKLFVVQVLEANSWKERADIKYTQIITETAKRGNIVTNDGEIIASDYENYDIILDPYNLKEEKIDTLLNIFSNYVEYDVNKVRADILERKKSDIKYYKMPFIVDYMSHNNMEKDISKEGLLNIAVYFKKNYTRKYIESDAFKEIVGFLNSEKEGAYGVEKTYDSDLTGIDGIQEKYRTMRNFFSISTATNNRIREEGRNGYNAVLTIDSFIQYSLNEELKKTYEEYDAVSTMGIVMEVDTGRILAMSSYPKATNNAEVKNRPITDLFEPGSIFKPITVAIGLDKGVIQENSYIHSDGYIQVADRTIRDHDSSTVGTLPLEQIIAHSGNVGMVKIAQMINQKDFYNYIVKLGFGNKTGIDTYAELSRQLFKENELTPVKKANISFGQGIDATQLQIMMALNTVINDGKLLKPYIVDKLVNDEGETVKLNQPEVIAQVFTEESSRINRKFMESVVNDGTGKGVQIPGYRIGGKTGTAQKSGSRGYESGKYFSSFFLFFPADKPKYAMLITVDEPKGTYYGAAVALPAAKAVLEKIIQYRNILPDNSLDGNVIETNKETTEYSRLLEQKTEINLKKAKELFENNIMPDLTGYSLREIMSIYPVTRYPKYVVNGSGRLVSQYPKAGEKISGNVEIRFNLE